MGFIKVMGFDFKSPVNTIVFTSVVAVTNKGPRPYVMGFRGDTYFITGRTRKEYSKKRAFLANRFGFKHGFVVTKLK